MANCIGCMRPLLEEGYCEECTQELLKWGIKHHFDPRREVMLKCCSVEDVQEAYPLTSEQAKTVLEKMLDHIASSEEEDNLLKDRMDIAVRLLFPDVEKFEDAL